MLKKFIFFCLINLSVIHAISQNVEPGGGSGGTGPGGNLDPGTGNEVPTSGWVPIDGGIVALLAAGVGYGAKKAYDYRSKRQKKSTNTLD